MCLNQLWELRNVRNGIFKLNRKMLCQETLLMIGFVKNVGNGNDINKY